MIAVDKKLGMIECRCLGKVFVESPDCDHDYVIAHQENGEYRRERNISN